MVTMKKTLRRRNIKKKTGGETRKKYVGGFGLIDIKEMVGNVVDKINLNPVSNFISSITGPVKTALMVYNLIVSPIVRIVYGGPAAQPASIGSDSKALVPVNTPIPEGMTPDQINESNKSLLFSYFTTIVTTIFNAHLPFADINIMNPLLGLCFSMLGTITGSPEPLYNLKLGTKKIHQLLRIKVKMYTDGIYDELLEIYDGKHMRISTIKTYVEKIKKHTDKMIEEEKKYNMNLPIYPIADAIAKLNDKLAKVYSNMETIENFRELNTTTIKLLDDNLDTIEEIQEYVGDLEKTVDELLVNYEKYNNMVISHYRKSFSIKGDIVEEVSLIKDSSIIKITEVIDLINNSISLNDTSINDLKKNLETMDKINSHVSSSNLTKIKNGLKKQIKELEDYNQILLRVMKSLTNSIKTNNPNWKKISV
jgi:hypothetical protein